MKGVFLSVASVRKCTGFDQLDVPRAVCWLDIHGCRQGGGFRVFRGTFMKHIVMYSIVQFFLKGLESMYCFHIPHTYPKLTQSE